MENATNPDCDDVHYLQMVVTSHQISQPTYDAMINAFFGIPLPAEKGFTAAEITAKLADYSCGDLIHIGGSALVKNNDDLDITSDPPFICQYSFDLLKGISTLFNPDDFYFSKAAHPKDPSNTDVVLRAVKNGETVYLADYSDRIP